MEKTAGANEIDLLEIIARCFDTLKRNLFITFFFPLAGLGIGIILSLTARDTFLSELLIETTLLQDKECEFLFDQLGKGARLPGLSQKATDELVKLRYEVIRTETKIEKEDRDKSVYLQVKATVTDTKVFSELEKLVVKFVDESEPVTRHRREQQKFYDSMIAKIDIEILAMKKLQNQVSISGPVTYLDPSELYEASVRVYRDKMEYDKRLAEIKKVHLIKGFDSLTIDARLSMWIVGFVGLFLGFMLSLLILFLRFFSRYYKAYAAHQ